jgi:hypothetical protein
MINQFISIREALRLVDPINKELFFRLRFAGMRAADAQQLSNYEAKVLLTMHPPGEDLGAMATPWQRKQVASLLALRGFELLDPGPLTGSEANAICSAFVPGGTRPKKYDKKAAQKSPLRGAMLLGLRLFSG